MAVTLITDSLASIPAEDAAAAGIDVVSLYINDGDANVLDVDLDMADFYRRLADMRTLPTSSQPAVDAFLSAFRRAVEGGSEVLGVFVSRKMSGTLEAARIAADMLRSEIPGARVELFDTGSNSMQEGFAVLAAAKAAQAGETIERCIESARETVARTRYLFMPESLEYLRRGGRIGAASALLGGLLQIKPILTVENGETTTFAKVRTRGKAVAEMARAFADDVAANGLRRVIVHYIGEPGPAQAFATEYIEPVVGSAVRVIPVSAVVGLHVGPAVAIAYETERALR
ncbi:MAG: DegV family protein [Coriobacteriia bacterium]|nr:DegV family protein [Coriobacteriia bacterium]